MASAHRASRGERPRGSKFTFIAVIIALVVGQGIVANAGTTDRSRSDGSTSDTTVVHSGGSSASTGGSTGGSVSPAVVTHSTTATRSSAGGAAQAAKTPIVSSEVDAFQGLQAGGTASIESDWTSGNLCQGNGTCYKELDNVPHRIKLKNLTAGDTYEFTVLLDHEKAGVVGYDNMNGQTAVSGVTGGITVTQNANTSSGCGAATTCLSYTFSFVASGTTAEIRFNAHLAIGSHLFSGSALSVRLDGSARNVPLPVKDILLDIRAHKFNDVDGDGAQGATELDLSGWTMTVYKGTGCATGQEVTIGASNTGSDPNPGTTDGTGNVDWTNLSASQGDQNGDFSVKETLQLGWQNTTGGVCQTVGISSNQNIAIFGNQQLAPTLTLSKSGASTVGFGQNITWTITVANGGNAAATNVQLTDTLPAGFTFVSSNPDATSSPTPPFCTNSGSTVSCSLGTVGANSQAQVTITATAPTTCGPFTNSVSGTFGTGQTIPGSPATSSGDVTGCASTLTLSKSGASTVGFGQNITWTITVANGGNAAATNVQLTDTLPAGFTFVSSNPDATSSPTPPFCTNSGSTVSCSLGTVGANSQAQVTITATAPTTCGPFTNSVSGTFGTGQTIPGSPATSGGNVTGCTAPPPPPPPPPAPGDIVIVKGGPALAHVGDTITYTFDVTLAANSPAVHSVTVSDPICNTGTLSGPTGDDGDALLEQSETWHYSCTHLVTASDPDPLPNTATANGIDANGNPVSDDDSHVVDIIHPGIQIVKTADPTHGSPGDTITYTFKVTNTGDVDLTDISVDDNVIGHICDIALLKPQETKVCTKDFTIPKNANISVENVAIADGVDSTGKHVTDDDNAIVNVVLGVTITPTKTPPAGVAFTGNTRVVPLGFLALLLLLVGSGMLWASRRRGEHAPGYED